MVIYINYICVNNINQKMKIDPEIDYTDTEAVRKILSDIRAALDDSGIKHSKAADDLNVNPSTFSQFLKGEKYRVTEYFIRKTVTYVNKRDFSAVK